MVKQIFGILSILMMLVAVSQPGPLIPRPGWYENSFEDDLNHGLGWSPEVWNWPGLGEPDLGIHRPYRSTNDYSEEEIDESESGGIPEWFPSSSESDENADYDETGHPGNVDMEYDSEETVGGGSYETSDGVGNPDEDDETVHGVDDFHRDEDNNIPIGEGNVPSLGDDNGFEEDKIRPWFFGGGSIFDNPFFNLGQVRNYFHQMEKALEHVFRQTLDEARLLNGTYANTTEEEVEIGGKKYIVQKSVIRGATNNSAIYVETLSSKPKEEGVKEANITIDAE